MDGGQCPFTGKIHISNSDWWPNQLNLKVLHRKSDLSDPMDPDFDYGKEFKKLNLKALRKDVFELMTTSQDWWPADYGDGLAQRRNLPDL